MSPTSQTSKLSIMNRRFVRVMLGISALLLLTAVDRSAALNAQSVTARGRLQQSTPTGWFPVQGLVVTLRAPNGARTLPTYSGPDGMYYLTGIPQGQYFLEVWVPNAAQPFLVLQITITYVGTPYGWLCDIPPVNVP
jgi:hypothetical protein